VTDENFGQCVDNLFEEFDKYDSFVDVTSAWEEILTDQFSHEFDGFYFDRFPEETVSHGDTILGPAFTAYFSNEYGIAFYLVEELPRSEQTLTELLSRVEEHDQEYQFYTGDGTRNSPDTYDLALLTSEDNAQTAEHLVSDLLSKSKVNFNSNLVLLSYSYEDPNKNPRYEFSRLTMVDQNFRDDILPAGKRPSTVFSMENGGFGAIGSPPGFFKDKRATGVLCNKNLSELYFACYLWHNAFTDYLTRAEKIVWHGKDPEKTIEFDILVDELYSDVQSRYIPVDGVEKRWVRQALDFLTRVGVAEQLDDKKYTVKFRNLQDRRREHKDVVTRRSEIADLAHLMANLHCETVLDMDPGERSGLNMDTTNVALDEDVVQAEMGDW